MADDIKLQSFPATEYEALALLYVQAQDLTGKTPAEIYDLFYDARKAIKEQSRERRKTEQYFR